MMKATIQKHSSTDRAIAHQEKPEARRYGLLRKSGTVIAALSIASSTAGSALAQSNGEWDKTFPKSERVDHRKVAFKNRYGITLAADLYQPKDRGDKRLAALPDIPTFKELGYDAEFYIWAGVFAPAATPAPVQQALRDAVRSAVASEEFKATMTKLATPIAYMDAPEFAQYWAKDAKRLEAALQKIGKVGEK